MSNLNKNQLITDLECQLLNGLAQDKDEYMNGSVEYRACNESSLHNFINAPKKSVGGVVASLLKKGMIELAFTDNVQVDYSFRFREEKFYMISIEGLKAIQDAVDNGDAEVQVEAKEDQAEDVQAEELYALIILKNLGTLSANDLDARILNSSLVLKSLISKGFIKQDNDEYTITKSGLNKIKEDQAEAKEDQAEAKEDQAEAKEDQAEAKEDQAEAKEDQAEAKEDQAEAKPKALKESTVKRYDVHQLTQHLEKLQDHFLIAPFRIDTIIREYDSYTNSYLVYCQTHEMNRDFILEAIESTYRKLKIDWSWPTLQHGNYEITTC